MWANGAHIVFLLLLAVIFRRVINSTLVYGKKLRRLRQSCSAAFDTLNASSTPKEEEFIILIREKESQNIVYRNNCGANERELMRIMADPQMKERVVSFKHIPDAENMSHIIGVYKDNDKTYECMACMHT